MISLKTYSTEKTVLQKLCNKECHLASQMLKWTGCQPSATSVLLQGQWPSVAFLAMTPKAPHICSQIEAWILWGGSKYSWVSYIKIKGPLLKCFLPAPLPGASLNAFFFVLTIGPCDSRGSCTKAPFERHTLLWTITPPFSRPAWKQKFHFSSKISWSKQLFHTQF